jgi:flagellar basal body-associated protein FliL
MKARKLPIEPVIKSQPGHVIVQGSFRHVHVSSSAGIATEFSIVGILAELGFSASSSSVVAAMVSNTNTEAEKSAIWEKARKGAAYRLDDTIRTNSRNKAKRAVACTALLYATVEDATAQKEVDFKVEQAADGRLSISVSPFQF